MAARSKSPLDPGNDRFFEVRHNGAMIENPAWAEQFIRRLETIKMRRKTRASIVNNRKIFGPLGSIAEGRSSRQVLYALRRHAQAWQVSRLHIHCAWFDAVGALLRRRAKGTRPETGGGSINTPQQNAKTAIIAPVRSG